MPYFEGTPGDDILVGTPDVDQINGLAGDDVLVGGQGDDLLDGKEGADVFVGGAGADTFVLRADLIPGTGEFEFYEDFIVDFAVAEGDVFVLPTLPDGTPVTFEMLEIEASGRGNIGGTEIEVLDEEIAFIANVGQLELFNSPELFIPAAEFF